MKKFFRKNKWLTIVLVILATALVVGTLAASTTLIAQVGNNSLGGIREVNEDNLIEIEDYEDLDGEKTNGIKVTVKEDGTIILNGEAEADISFTIKTFAADHAMITKPDDDGYTLCGITAGSLETVYLQVAQAENVLARSTKYGANFTAEAVAEVVVTIEIAEGTELDNIKINPVVVPGSTAQSFYK